MNNLQMKQELADRLGAYDQSVSYDDTRLQRWINMAQQYICGSENWPFMYYHEIIQTVVDITTGTVAVAVGGTTITLTDAPTESCTERFIRFGSDSNWYKIAAHTAAATTATISPAYYGSSNLTASTYKIRKLFYATSTPLDSIYTVKKMAPGRFLESSNSRDADVFLPLFWDGGAVYKYISSVPDTMGGARISFLYSPSSVENMQVTGVKKLVDLSASTDQSLIPVRWNNVIVDQASFYGFSTLNDSRASVFEKKADEGIQQMMSVYDSDLGRQRITRSLNTGVFEGPAYVLPPQYGVNQ